MMNRKMTIGNVCFLKDQVRKQVLFLKRNREPMKDLYTGVGGKTEFFEDVRTSCFREVQEETGLTALDMQCKGILKTILDGTESFWILFVYVCDRFSGMTVPCSEGELSWVPYDQISSLKLIGFIECILPQVLFDQHFIEGTIRHDSRGNVLDRILSVAR